VDPVDNELWREIGAMDATIRKRLIANGESIGVVVESYPLEVSIVDGNARGGGAGTWRVLFRSKYPTGSVPFV
jgi:hypothetical protein